MTNLYTVAFCLLQAEIISKYQNITCRGFARGSPISGEITSLAPPIKPNAQAAPSNKPAPPLFIFGLTL